MPRSWFGAILTAAMLSVIATAAARADCYCRRDDQSSWYCGQVEQKDKEEVVLSGIYDGVNHYRPDLETPLALDKYFYCGAERKPGTTAPSSLSSPPGRPVIAAPPPPVRSFGIVGSNTIGEELMPALIAAFARRERLILHGKGCFGRLVLRPAASREAAFPETTINCEARGTHFGIPALKDGQADIAMLSRPITDEERRDIAPVIPDERVLALDGVVVIVSPHNPVTALTLDQIAGIFAGKINNWSAVDLPAAPIIVYMRNENSGTRDTFDSLVMKPRGLTFAPTQHLFRSSSELSESVAADPHGIGFIGYAYRHHAKALDIKLSCGLTYDATEATIKSEDYPLTRRLFLYTGAQHSEFSTKLVEYALSDEAQPIIESANFINLSIIGEDARYSRDRISRYADPTLRPSEPGLLEFDPAVFGKLRRYTRNAERLSVSIRFQLGSAVLDSRAKDDVGRLAKYLNGDASGRKVLLAGFTDATDTFTHNLKLSHDRAVEVRNALINRGVDAGRLKAEGFSELLPVVCNRADTDARRGNRQVDNEVREKNRRVEAWLLP